MSASLDKRYKKKQTLFLKKKRMREKVKTKLTTLDPRGRIIFLDSTSCKLSLMKMVTWQPVDKAPEAKTQVTVILPFTSITVVVAGWSPVVSTTILL